MRADSRIVPYLAALIIGLTAGTLAHSPIVAGVVACVVSVAWAVFANRFG